MQAYARINGAGVCVGVKQVGGKIDQPDHIELPDYDESVIGKRWTGQAFESQAVTVAEAAALELAQVDQATGMSRTLRETLLTLAAKVGADLPYLAAQEAKAAAARAKLPKG